MSETTMPLIPSPVGDPEIGFEDIDPIAAKKLLERNTHNRTKRVRVAAAYAADMRAGAWQLNGESIKVATDGVIIDGQHRLYAIIESGTTQRMLVIRNLPMETQDVVDTGAKRKFSDQLKLRGEAHYNTVASVTKRVAMWTSGQRSTKGNFAVSMSGLFATLERHPDIRVSAQVADAGKGNVAIYSSVLGLCHWLFSHLPTHNQEERELLAKDVTYFFDRLYDGASLAHGDPIWTLRRTAADHSRASSRADETVVTAWVIKAWNAYRDGRSITVLRYSPGGASPERFPEPK